MRALLLDALPIAVWALILLGYSFMRASRDRIERRNFEEQLKAGLDENRDLSQSPEDGPRSTVRVEEAPRSP